MNCEARGVLEKTDLIIIMASCPLGGSLRGGVPVQAPAWPAPQGELDADKAPLPLPRGPDGELSSGRPKSLTPFGAALERALLAVCEAVIVAAPGLDALDSRHVTVPSVSFTHWHSMKQDYSFSAYWSANFFCLTLLIGSLD